mmetsp:Transcript_1319/g.1922  ORF Transcript_1319/g.1922 Transcript_1319/m.1922 type:complete len:224 (-) Transcript_1319:190-861(-)
MFQSPPPPSSPIVESRMHPGRNDTLRGTGVRSPRSIPATILGNTSSLTLSLTRSKGTASKGADLPLRSMSLASTSSASMGMSTVTSDIAVNPGGGTRLSGSSLSARASCSAPAPSHCPAHTYNRPSRSTTGAASTKTWGSSFLMDGIFTHSPPDVYSQPWYGHCTLPSTSLPSEMGQARCAHSSLMHAAVPVASRKATQGTLNRSKGIMVAASRVSAKATGNQ